MSAFEDLIAEAEAAPVAGWDFSWLDGRATEQRPSWGYARLMAARLAGVGAAMIVCMIQRRRLVVAESIALAQSS